MPSPQSRQRGSAVQQKEQQPQHRWAQAESCADSSEPPTPRSRSVSPCERDVQAISGRAEAVSGSDRAASAAPDGCAALAIAAAAATAQEGGAAQESFGVSLGQWSGDWEMCTDPTTGGIYYFNARLGVSSWVLPISEEHGDSME